MNAGIGVEVEDIDEIKCKASVRTIKEAESCIDQWFVDEPEYEPLLDWVRRRKEHLAS